MRHPKLPYAAAAALCLAFHGNLFAGAAVDDAYISYTYARNLLHGHGLVYRADAPPVEGYSNFLWTLLHVPAAAFGDPIAYSKILGVLLLGLNLWLAGRAVRRLVPDSGAAPWLAVLLLVASPGFVYWHLSGLEPPLVAAALLAAWSVAPAWGGRSKLWVEAAAWTVLALSRIDAVLLVAVALGARIVLASRGAGASAPAARAAARPADVSPEPRTVGRLAQQEAIRVAMVVAALYGAYTAWRWFEYGSFVPNTVYAKSMPWSVAWPAGWRYAAGALARQPWLVLAPFAAWQLARRDFRRQAAVLTAAAVIVVQVVYAAAAGGDWMPLHRFVIPVLPPAAVLVAAWAGERRAVAAPLAVLAVAAGPLAWPLGNTAFEVRVHTENTATGRALGRALATLAEPGMVTGIGAAGAAPYFSGLPNLDLSGLTDAHIAHRAPPAPIPGLPAGHQRGDGAYVLSQKPGILVFVLGRSEFPGQELSDAAIAFEPAFYAEYEPVRLRASRAPHHIRLPHASAVQARQLEYLAGLRPVPGGWGAEFAAGSELEFTVYRRLAGNARDAARDPARDPVRAVFAALAAAQEAGLPLQSQAALDQGAAVLEAAGLVPVRWALEARYAFARGDRARAADALTRAAQSAGGSSVQLRLWVLQDPGLRTLVNTASVSGPASPP